MGIKEIHTGIFHKPISLSKNRYGMSAKIPQPSLTCQQATASPVALRQLFHNTGRLLHTFCHSMTAPPKIMLASSSQTRKDMLTRAGLAFEAAAPDVDERQVQQSIAALSFGDQATALALAKARNVAQRYKDALVIGSDQSLEVDGEVLHKVSSASAAKSQLQRLMGRPHRLHTAVSVVNNGNEIFRHVEVPVLHMRNLPEKELDAYVESGGSTILASVGCYQLEGRGIQLFEKIDGDYFAILGLPLLPLLSFLRRAGVMPS